MNEQKIESHRKEVNPYLLIPVFVFSLGALYLCVQIVGWIQSHWSIILSSPWFIGFIVILCLLIVLLIARIFIHLSTPAAHKIIDVRERHQTVNLQARDMELKEQMFQYAIRTGAHIEMDGMKITIPTTSVTVSDVTQQNVPALPAPALILPDKCSMLDVIRRWDLRDDNLFLAYGKGKREIACTLEGFMHVAHDAQTGGGKTSQWKIEESMLLKLGVQIIHANPHFAPIDKKGNDWRPIARAIEEQGLIEIAPGVKISGLVYDFQYIADMLKWLALKEINRRFAMQRQGNYDYKPVYLFIDEWPAIVKRHPESAEHQAEILQRGRAVDVCVDTNSQGFLLNDVDLKGSARENFNTAYHMGGSVHSASKLLDMPIKDINKLMQTEQIALGRGVALLRNNEALPHAELVRLPLADNEFVYYLFGRADEWMLPEYRSRKQQERYEEEYPEMEELQPKKENMVESSGVPSGRYSGRTWEVAQEASGSDRKPKTDELDSSVKVLREIGKKLRSGMSPKEVVTEIVKTNNIPYGRGTQEINATVNMVVEMIAKGEM
jgi:hypothetical protein